MSETPDEIARRLVARWLHGDENHRQWLCDIAEPDIAKEIAEVREAGRRAGLEEAAKWHDEQAILCGNITETMRREWTGPEIPREDRLTNYVNARRLGKLGRRHKQYAKAIRALKDAAPTGTAAKEHEHG